MHKPTLRSTIMFIITISAFVLSHIFNTYIFRVLLFIGLYVDFIIIRITYFWSILFDIIILTLFISIYFVNYKLSFYLLISFVTVMALYGITLVILYRFGYPVFKSKYDYKKKS